MKQVTDLMMFQLGHCLMLSTAVDTLSKNDVEFVQAEWIASFEFGKSV